ncbi:MAG TPA: TylF/MycF/NovP-related O-methyltransferase, partial [Magnetospirillaceae bacterium]|nr:TylF/MycF/NovP-related O-methyltransferase [Magnetospirillaceae bacterium]
MAEKDFASFLAACRVYIRDLEYQSPSKDFRYSVVIPGASYSPWLSDMPFQAAYELLKANTMVDLYRCYELWTLAGQCARLSGDILEVGVWRGGSGCLMAVQAKLMGSKSKIYLADTFSGVVKAGENDPSYKGGEHADTSVDFVLQSQQALGLANIELLVGIFPDATGKAVENSRFSLCHIDVDVYSSAADVLDWVWPRLL